MLNLVSFFLHMSQSHTVLVSGKVKVGTKIWVLDCCVVICSALTHKLKRLRRLEESKAPLVKLALHPC